MEKAARKPLPLEQALLPPAVAPQILALQVVSYLKSLLKGCLKPVWAKKSRGRLCCLETGSKAY